jgi:hypothetical protein
LSQLAAAEIVVPRALDPIAREALANELYEVARRIFAVDRATLVALLVSSRAEHAWIQLYRDERGALGGFAAVQLHEREMGGRRIAIVRSQAATLREHRGANLVSGFVAERVLRYLMAHPRRPLYLFTVIIHPSSYAQLTRYLGDVAWPREGEDTPAEVSAMMEALADELGFERVDPANGMVRRMGWQTIDSRDDRAFWERCERTGVQMFLRANPGYGQGHGLVTIARITAGGLARAIGRYARARSERGARELAARARAGLAALLPAPAGAQ